MQFCKDAVRYPSVAVPSPEPQEGTTVSLAELVRTQEKAAASTYFYHLAGLKVDAWDHKDAKGAEEDECTKAVRMMACQTYFPMAEAGCKKGESTKFLKPCKNVCSHYVNACQVQCCDESVKCVFERNISILGGVSELRSGYADESGPSATCTGAGLRRATSLPVWLLATLLSLPVFASGVFGDAARSFTGMPWRKFSVCLTLVAAAIALQGCGDIIGHATAAWQSKPKYLDNFQYIPEGKSVSHGVLNSCDIADLPKDKQCSGNGVCKQWKAQSKLGAPMSFCMCDTAWADPECRTRRKSQTYAFFISMLGGWLGLDSFYLGEWGAGFAKMSTLGGLGMWWLFDIVRIGCSPIYASEFRLAADLPHSLYVFLVVTFAAVLGYNFFGLWVSAAMRKKRKSDLLMRCEDEFMTTRSAAPRSTWRADLSTASHNNASIMMAVEPRPRSAILAQSAPASVPLHYGATASAHTIATPSHIMGLQPHPLPITGMVHPIPTPPIRSPRDPLVGPIPTPPFGSAASLRV
jgi:TM2 domain-containing membrane protein YozV